MTMASYGHCQLHDDITYHNYSMCTTHRYQENRSREHYIYKRRIRFILIEMMACMCIHCGPYIHTISQSVRQESQLYTVLYMLSTPLSWCTVRHRDMQLVTSASIEQFQITIIIISTSPYFTLH